MGVGADKGELGGLWEVGWRCWALFALDLVLLLKKVTEGHHGGVEGQAERSRCRYRKSVLKVVYVDVYSSSVNVKIVSAVASFCGCAPEP